MAAVAIRIGGAALAAMMGARLSTQPAQAGYIVTLEQVGSDVVATGGGFIDLDGLTFFNNEAPSAAIFPSIAEIITGPTTPTALEVYQGFSGPQNFGGGSRSLLIVVVATPSPWTAVTAFLPCRRASTPTTPCLTSRPIPARLSAASA